jgi:D-amino-acid dehydrogenase
LRRETGIEYDRQEGILRICTDPEEFDALAANTRAAAAAGIRAEVVSAGEALRIEPALANSQVPIVGGVYTPEDESGDAHKFTQRLAELAKARGVEFLHNRSVDRIETDGERISGIRMAETGERMTADAYVVALGSDSPLLLSSLGIRIPVYPLKGYSITIHLPESSALIAPTVSISDEAGKLVFSRLGNRLRVAGTAELSGYDRSVDKARCRAILARTGKVFPDVATGARVEHWAGLRPATPSNVPLIGPTRYRNLYLNTGHGTLGWTLACGSGRALADLVSGRAPGVRFVFCMTENHALR